MPDIQPPTENWTWIDQVVKGFEDAWRAGKRPLIEDYLSAEGADRQALLIELIKMDLERRWQAGETPRVEEYRSRFAELQGNSEAWLDLICAEARLARQRGEDCTPTEYAHRFPEYAGALWKLLHMGTETDVPAGRRQEILPKQVGRYHVEEEIARGGMGRIVRVRDEDFDRPLAMKVLLNRGGDAEERFVREARMTGLLQHPGIPPVHVLGKLDDGRPYFIMKLIQGHSLRELLQARSSPAEDLPRYIAIFAQVCQTVGYAHARGVIHRDLKPGNIMVGAFGEVQVMDWGLAKVLQPGTEESASTQPASETVGRLQRTVVPADATAAGHVMGTAAYMAPEQARGEIGKLDARADVFGLGAILLEILTGNGPYKPGDARAVLRQAERGDLADASTRLAECAADAELVDLARRCLAPWKEDRPADGAAVSEAVAVYQAELQRRLQQTEIDRAAAVVRADSERKRRRVVLALAVAVVLLIVGGSAAGLWYQAEQLRQEAEQQQQHREVALRREYVNKEVQAALQEATDQRKELIRKLKDEGEVRELLSDIDEWGVRLQSARAAWRRADALAKAGLELLDPDLTGKLADMEKSLGADEAVWRVAKLLHEVLAEGAVPNQAYAEYERAVSLDDGQRIRDAKPGMGHIGVANTLHNLASAYIAMGQPAKAALLHECNLHFWEAKLGGDHIEVAYALHNLANTYYAMEQYAKAAALHERGLHIREAILGKDHLEVTHPLVGLAEAINAKGESARAVPLYERGLQIREARLGKDHIDVAGVLSGLANTFVGLGAYSKALPLNERSLRIRETKLGRNAPAVAEELSRLGMVYFNLGRHADAETVLLRSLEICESEPGIKFTDSATILGNLGILYTDTGQHAKGGPMLVRSLQITETKVGKDSISTAKALHSLANLYIEMGEYSQAESHLLRSLAIAESKLGKKHPEVAFTLNDLARLYTVVGQHAKAEPLYLRSIAIHQAAANFRWVAAGKQNLGLLHNQMKQYAAAEKCLLESIHVCESKDLTNDFLFDFVLTALAEVYVKQNRPDDALKALGRGKGSLDMLGKTHPRQGDVFSVKAMAFWAKNDPDKAIDFQQKAIELYRVRYGKDHPRTHVALAKLAVFLLQTKRLTEAFRTMDRSMQGLRKQAAEVLPILPESEQLTFITNLFETRFSGGVSFALQPGLSAENRLRTAAWVLNGKSLIQQSLAERILLARDNNTRAANAILAELIDVRLKLASLNFHGSNEAGADSHRKRIDALREKEIILQLQLHRAGLVNRNDPWVEIDELRQKLSAKSVYVDFLRFSPTAAAGPGRIEPEKGPSIYVAWISTREQDTVIVNLGSAEKIDAAVREAGEEFKKAPRRIRDVGEEEAEKDARRKLSVLSKLVLEPLLPHLSRYSHWILGPDSNLWLVPWGCLPLDETHYVIEKHTPFCVTSGRDLVLNALQIGAKATGPVIIADPDFDAGRVSNAYKENPSQAIAALRRRFRAVAALPGTGLEADAIGPALAKLAGTQPQRFLGTEATVGAFQALKSPKVLVVSTHAFFLPNQPVSDAPNDRINPDVIPGLENPLLRAGLLLAGFNRAGSGETGVLTGLEIVGTDLRGTELVVLSASETGLGDIRNGEGVAGLRQAFQLAGAQTVVATLWSPPDRATGLLMTRFFENMAAGQTKVDALRESQLYNLQQRRHTFGGAHPLFWGAFTLTGR